jgi:hypothetical protein
MGRLSRSAAVLGAAALLILGGAAYALASSSDGTITVCVSHKGGTLYKARKCAKHDKQLSWNKQGLRGPRGATGATGPQGPHGVSGPKGDADLAGPAGPGVQFTTTSGNPGPTLSNAGTYYVVVEASITNGATALTGDCAVVNTKPNPTINLLGGAIALAPSGFARFSFSGMAVEPAAGRVQLSCEDTSGAAVTPSAVQWWISPIGS